jgi:hypothetical protein
MRVNLQVDKAAWAIPINVIKYFGEQFLAV